MPEKHPTKIGFLLAYSGYLSAMVCPWWTSAFLLAVHRLCGVIEGRLSHFLPRWLRTGWQSVISQENIP